MAGWNVTGCCDYFPDSIFNTVFSDKVGRCVCVCDFIFPFYLSMLIQSLLSSPSPRAQHSEEKIAGLQNSSFSIFLSPFCSVGPYRQPLCCQDFRISGFQDFRCITIAWHTHMTGFLVFYFFTFLLFWFFSF